MNEWVLILTVIFNSGSTTTMAVTSVPGFESQKACLAAGEKWGKSNMKGALPGLRMTAVCAPQREEKKT